MNTTVRVLRYQSRDVLRSRGVIAWGLFFVLLGDVLLRFGGTDEKALLSIANIVLFIVPLVSLVFGAMYLYGAREFNELLLAQPVRREHLFAGLFLGIVLPLAGATAAGIAVPFVVHGVSDSSHTGLVAWLSGTAALLTFVFVAIAFWIALRVEDRARGLALALLVWLFLAVIYDALVLGIVAAFAKYPLERPVIALMLLNPVDLARVLLLIRLDVAAMMGYTGAVFQRVFGSSFGIVLAMTALTAWCAVPLWRARSRFSRLYF